MEIKKNILLSITIILVLLGCLAAGKYIFMPDTVASADDNGKFQVSCAANPTGAGRVVCAIIDTTSGAVVNIIRPRTNSWCSVPGNKKLGRNCNESLGK